MALGDGYPPVIRKAFEACRKQFLAAAGFSALINVLYLAPTIYMMQVYDRVVPTGGIATLVWLTLVLALALGSLAALDNVRSRLMSIASLKLNDELSGRILEQLVSNRRSEATGQAMREFDTLRQTMTGQAAMAIFDTPWTPIYFIVAFLIHPALGAMILAGGAVLFVLAILNERNSRSRGREAMRANAQAYAAQEALAAQAETIAAFGMRGAMVARQQQARAQGLHASSEAQASGMKYNSMIKFARMLMQSLALGLGAVLAIEGLISAGTIIGASVLLSRALQPIEQLVGSWSQIVASRQSLETLRTLLIGAATTPREYHPLPEPAGHIRVSGLTMTHPSGEGQVLNNVGIELRPGEIVALIGPSGAGKSTLARIIAGALPIEQGEVRIDGASYADWAPDELARHIGYMPQEATLLPGTIAENISRMAVLRGEAPDAVAERINEAAQHAGVHQLILQLEGGYNARVGDPRFGLSGGQRQRISLARALYGNPKVLVLDEPNASLDSEGERVLLWALSNAKARGIAVLLVAHQANVIGLSDRLVVMRDGAIQHQGQTKQVMAALQQEAARNNVTTMTREGKTGV